MQLSTNNNDDSHIKNPPHSLQQVLNNDSNPTIIPSNSIRFAFPQRPSQQDHSHIRPYRTATYNSLKLTPSLHFSPQRHPSRHRYNHSFWANFPFFMASSFSVVGTFMGVRSIVVRGYLVDHSSWDGKGHHYDQHPLVFLNTAEMLLMMTSLLCGLSVCTLVVLKTRIYHNAVSGYCVVGALIHASCSFATTFLFYTRTFDLVENFDGNVYSRGFYSCMISGAVMLLSMFGFFLDWLLDSPSNGPLSVVLNAMLLPSVMYCCTLSIGTFTFMWIEDWEYSQAMMFCATALTTIGYGDVAPMTPHGRLFFLVYATFGICVVAYFLLSLRAVMINGSTFNLMMKVNLIRVESLHNYARQQRQRDRQRSRHEQQWQQQQHECDRDDVLTRNNSSIPTFNLVNDVDDDDDELPTTTATAAATTAYDQPRSHQLVRHRSTDVISTFSNYTLANILKEENRQIWVHVITRSGIWRMSVIYALSWFGGAAVFCILEENWSYLDALYFAFATQLTIGFGDLVPQTVIAQEFWFVYIIISIAVAAYFICLFGDVLAEKLLIDGESGGDSDTADDDEDNDDDDGGYSGYEFNKHKDTGEMVEDNDFFKNNRTSTNLSGGFTNNIDADINTTVKTSFNERNYYPYQQNIGTSSWTLPNPRQENSPHHDSSTTFYPQQRRLIDTPQQRQGQPTHHQSLQHRTNSLPIIPIDQYQKRHTYGSLPQHDQGTIVHNKKNKQKVKSSKYLPVAVTSNTHHLPLD